MTRAAVNILIGTPSDQLFTKTNVATAIANRSLRIVSPCLRKEESERSGRSLERVIGRVGDGLYSVVVPEPNSGNAGLPAH